MSAAQVRWLVMLAAAVSTALIGQADLLGEPWKHVIAVIGVIATTVAAFMLQNPWSVPQPVYIVVKDGVGNVMTQAQAETSLKHAAEDLPQPLEIHS